MAHSKKAAKRVCIECRQKLHRVKFWPGHRRCHICMREKTKYYSDDPRIRMWVSSRNNSKSRGIEHTIEYQDIPLPKRCMYLRIQLDYRRMGDGRTNKAFNMASIDRIDSTKGYVPGNIQVISWLANKMKQNATPKQLLTFAHSIIRIHG